jgi:hypothetical protein
LDDGIDSIPMADISAAPRKTARSPHSVRQNRLSSFRGFFANNEPDIVGEARSEVRLVAAVRGERSGNLGELP